MSPEWAAGYTGTMRLPERVKIVEVGARDGLQNVARVLSVEQRLELIRRLAACGFTAIEVGSLVSAKAVPQMADSDEVYRRLEVCPGIDYIMLLARLPALLRAEACGIKHVAVFCAATDAFSLKNVRATTEQCLHEIAMICKRAAAMDIKVRGYVSCVLGCPYQGRVDVEQVCRIAARLCDYGCAEISLGDTIGVGTPGRVKNLIEAVACRVPIEKLAVHFHDSYGQALVNVFAALQAGITVVDSSVGGSGGCPFAPGAAGNVASEDLVYMLNGLGIRSGIDLKRLIDTAWFLADLLKCRPRSGLALAMAPQAAASEPVAARAL